MQITVIGRHLTLSEHTQQYAQEKVSKLPHFYDRVTATEVVIEPVNSHGYTVELVTHVEGHERFVATAEHEEQHAAIDLATDKMVRQLHDYKQRRRDDKKHPRDVTKQVA